MVKRLLLTGATGFIGSHAAAPLIERGFEVHALARHRPSGAVKPSVTWHEVDLLDPASADAVVRDVAATHLLHLAWYAEHGLFWEAQENLDWVAASLRLLRSFHAAGGRRAVVAGSCAEYDWSGDCCDGGTPLRPATLYGVAKDALRRVLEAYARSTGLSTAWGRIFFAYGPGEQPTRVVAAVARAVVAGEAVSCSSGRQLRDFLYVEDVASAFAALADSRASGAFDVGSGGAVELRDLLLRLERLAGRTELVRLGAAPERDEPARIVADPSRLRDEIGWSPAHGLDEGLERTLAWWRSARLASRT
jgi:nucleoside-diphosphate-sugar epimerase